MTKIPSYMALYSHRDCREGGFRESIAGAVTFTGNQSNFGLYFTLCQSTGDDGGKINADWLD